MRRRRKRSTASVPHIIVLIALVMVVFYLYANRKKNLPTPASRPGWMLYGDIINTYDIHVDLAQPSLIWYATSGGLKVYDRQTSTWNTWGTERGLVGDQVSSVAGNGGDSLWLSTWYGVQILNKKTGLLSPLPLPTTILAKRIFKVADDAAYLWIGTDGRGIYRYNKSTQMVDRFTEKDGMSENSVYAFCVTDTAVWAGGAGAGLSRFSRVEQVWHKVETPEVATAVTKIWSIKRQGNLLWMATSDAGIWRYNLHNATWKTYGKGTGMLADGTYSLLVDGDDVWVGTHYCLMRYSTQADAWLNIVKPGIHDYLDITALAVDDDHIWYGTFRKGIGMVDKKNVLWVDIPDGLTRDAIQAICTVGDTLLVGFGYDEGCIDRLDRTTLAWLGNINKYEGMDGLQVEDIITSAKNIYAATWAGVYVCDRKGGDWSRLEQADGLPNNDITSIVAAGDGVWIGTGKGLAFLHEEGMVLELLAGVSGKHITALAAVPQGGVWASVTGGALYYLEIDTKISKAYLEDNTDEITSLVYDKGSVWVGTRDAGVIEMSIADGEVVRHTQKSTLFNRLDPGLLHNRINDIFSPTEGVIWVATDLGISIHDTTKTWSALVEYDGLYDEEVYTLYKDEKYIWVGHPGGITRIEHASAYPYGTKSP